MSKITLAHDNLVDVIHPTIDAPLGSPSFFDLTNLIEVYHLSIIYVASHFLLLCLVTSFPILNRISFRKIRIAAEICILAFPFLASVTILSAYAVWIPYITIFTAMSILLQLNRVYVSFNWPEFVFQSRPVPAKSPLITNLYANIIMSVCICILAVDFQIFPQRFAKSRLYGYSLMDIGVSAFIALNALMSAEARKVANPSSHLRKAIAGSSGLLLLGFFRVCLVYLTRYDQDISEYGMHWNFFFTLAFTKIISSFLVSIFSSPLVIGILLTFLHQILLSLIISEIVLNPYRDGLILANKEGIFSLPGYISLYLFFVNLGKKLSQKRDRKSNMDTIFLIGDFLFSIIIATIVGALSHVYVEQSSRRLCNLAFICFSIVLICSIIIFELLMSIVIDILQYLMVMKKASYVKSCLNEALARKGLSIFLFANLVTGLTNLLVNTRTLGPEASFAINIVYIIAFTLFGLVSNEKQIKFMSRLTRQFWRSIG